MVSWGWCRQVVLPIGLVLAACGGSAEDTPGVSSSLPKDKPLEELNEEESEELCHATVDYLEEEIDLGAAFCQVLGVATAAELLNTSPEAASLAKAACSSFVDSCQDDPEGTLQTLLEVAGEGSQEAPTVEISFDLSESCDQAAMSSQACSARVDEYEACTTAQIDQYAALTSELPTCDDLSSEELASFQAEIQGWLELELPDSCAPLEEAGCLSTSLMGDFGLPE